MGKNVNGWRRWAKGLLEAFLDRFEGIDDEVFALMRKLDSSEVRVKAAAGIAPGLKKTRRG